MKNKHCSETIRKWAEPTRRKVGPFITAKMEETYIRDLTIRLGYPYVYVHQVLINVCVYFKYLSFKGLVAPSPLAATLPIPSYVKFLFFIYRVIMST